MFPLLYVAFMQGRYQNQPLEFVRVIQNCLLKEQQLVEHHDTMSVSLWYHNGFLSVLMAAFSPS